MDVAFEGQNAFVAAANGDFPLVVLLWGMALPKRVDLLEAEDLDGNTVMHHTASTAIDGNVAIVHFLLQQATAAGRPLTSLVEARNHAGETPLIRAAHAGNMAVVEALLQFGKAEINAKDKEGNTPAHHAAAQGHLWLLHYLLEAESRLNPSLAPTELGDTCKNKNTVLHYACAHEHKVVVQYLLSQGFDPQQANVDGVSALDIAKYRKIEWLVKVLESNDRTFAEAPTKCRESRLWVTLLYGFILSGLFSLSYFLPWWIAAPLILLVLWLAFKKIRKPHGHGGHSHGAKNVATLHPSKRDMVVTGSVVLAKPQKEPAFSKKHEPSGLSKLFKPQPEMIMGVWAAWVILFIFFHVVVWVDPVYKFVVTDWEPFLYTLVGIEVVFLLAWFRLATVCPSDPGVIRTFQVDITQMLANAATGVVPPEASYCRTCMIRKPIRSKHCAQCGVCVARMDHHCGWINRCVGYDNHRLFVCFLLLHNIVVLGFVLLAGVVFQHFLQPGNLDATLGSSVMRVWMQVPNLVADHLLALMVFLWGIGTVIGLSFMVVQHLGNMARNLTVNESINWRRYPYLKADPKNNSKGADKLPRLLNPFDKGGWHNTLEFWTRSGSSALDYRTVFRLPNAVDEPEEPIINVQVV